MATKDILSEEIGDGHLSLLIAMLEDNTVQWREASGALSQEEVCWQPHSGWHSIGAVILHNAEVEAYWLHEVITGELIPAELSARLLSEEIDQGAGKWPVPPSQPLSWYYAIQDEVRMKTRQILHELHDPLALYGKDRKFTLRWLLHHVITHEAYHCGQMALLTLQYNSSQKGK